MATDYFAHAFYGVLLDDDDQDTLNDLFDDAVDRYDEDAEYARQFGDEVPSPAESDRVKKVVPDTVFKQLLSNYNAPASAALVWTGDEDARPGRCMTDPGVWLIGFGIMSFPDPSITKFHPDAEWHMWVEAAG